MVLTCMTWYTKKHISLETLHRIHNCMISHVSQKNTFCVSKELSNTCSFWNTKTNHLDAAQQKKHSYINKKFLVYLSWWECIWWYFIPLKKWTTNVVCVGIYLWCKGIIYDKKSRIVFWKWALYIRAVHS